MMRYTTDTMAIVLYLSKRKMSSSAKQLFQSADLGLCQIVVLAIAAFEIGYLSEKGRIDVSLNQLRQYAAQYPAYVVSERSRTIIIDTQTGRFLLERPGVGLPGWMPLNVDELHKGK